MTAFNPFDNQDFRKELGETLDSKLTPITRLVIKHEAALNQSKGFKAAVLAIWTLAIVAFEYLFHRGR